MTSVACRAFPESVPDLGSHGVLLGESNPVVHEMRHVVLVQALDVQVTRSRRAPSQ